MSLGNRVMSFVQNIFFVVIVILNVSLFSSNVYGRNNTGFNITVLGAKGGIQDGNLTSFMIKPIGDDNAITCDAGSIVNGLKVANEKGAFSDIELPKGSPDSKIGHILKQHIKGYLISHAHLDHVLGMIIASPDDSSKPIYGLPSTIENMKSTHFNWRSWVNFADSGASPTLNKYKYAELQPLEKQALVGTNMQVTAFPLSHTQESTAFLIEQAETSLTKGSAVLCFGDTAADSVSKTDNLLKIWQATAELVKSGALKAVVIENSYTSDRPDKLLFGHLTPKYLLQELRRLETLAGGKGSLAGLPVIISHIKYSLLKNESIEQTILQELTAGNDMQVKFIIPEQGDSWLF
jgi:3',5'-cyclic-nucleotide phosphodiesterase